MESISKSDAMLFDSSIAGDKGGVIAALAEGGRVTVSGPCGVTPLLAAALEGHTDICGLLLAHGSDVNAMHHIEKRTALHYSAIKGQNNLVEALLSWGAEVNQQDYFGSTPLHAACQEGHLLCVFTLLKAGASITLPDDQGSLPIHLAAGSNRVEIVRTLLEHGCSPDTVGWKQNWRPEDPETLRQ